ncbi:hypothetical protein PENTCL1PPCAC_302, partial [Pristionchus entomophagus]
SDSLWQPSITACGAISRETVDDGSTATTKVYSNGTVSTRVNWAITYSCEMVMSNFPFDFHTCTTCFMLNTLNPREAILRLTSFPDATMAKNQINNEWALADSSIGGDAGDDGSMVYLDSLILRHPVFWVQLVILPSFVIGVFILTGLFLGESTDVIGTTVNFGLAVMVSLSIIIGILADGLPKSSTLPILGTFVLVQLFIISGAVLFIVARGQIEKASIRLLQFALKRKIE